MLPKLLDERQRCNCEFSEAAIKSTSTLQTESKTKLDANKYRTLQSKSSRKAEKYKLRNEKADDLKLLKAIKQTRMGESQYSILKEGKRRLRIVEVRNLTAVQMYIPSWREQLDESTDFKK